MQPARFAFFDAKAQDAHAILDRKRMGLQQMQKFLTQHMLYESCL